MNDPATAFLGSSSTDAAATVDVVYALRHGEQVARRFQLLVQRPVPSYRWARDTTAADRVAVEVARDWLALVDARAHSRWGDAATLRDALFSLTAAFIALAAVDGTPYLQDGEPHNQEA